MPHSRLRLEDVVVRRRFTTVLDGVSFSLDHGLIALLGPNGAGKTTLFSVLGEGRRIRSGSIRIAEHDLATVAGRDALRRRSGYQPQTPRLLQHQRVREAVAYAGWLKGIPESRWAEHVDAALDATHLDGLASVRCGRLSGGQAKRLAIAQAIVHRPDVLLLDEPTAALDPEERSQLLDVIGRLAAESSVLMSTHVVSDLGIRCSNVLVMDSGRITFDGSFDSFSDLGAGDPDEAYRRALGR